MSLKGKNIVFTGFRDKVLHEKIQAKGGTVVSGVSGTTDFLVAEGSKAVQSVKTKKARDLGATVMSRTEFESKFFPRSLLTRLFGSGSGSGAAKEKCYMTLDNGGRPFKVCYNSQRFWVFTHREKDNEPDELVYDKVVVKPTIYSKVFVGKSPRNDMTLFSGGHGPKFDGNSMLFQLTPQTYMYIGEVIQTFKVPDTIKSYVSPVGNSGVPYPYAIGTENTYLLIENTFIPNNMRKLQDPYDDLYGLTGKIMREYVKSHRMITKKIHGRLW